MHKRVDNKKPRVNTQKFKQNKKMCQGENIKSWVKTQIKNTPRKTRKEFLPKIKVLTTPRQAKTCRLEQNKLDQGRRKTTSGTNTTIKFSLLGRSRPPETNPESFPLDRKPNKFKNIKSKVTSDNLRCSKNWLSKQSRREKGGVS